MQNRFRVHKNQEWQFSFCISRAGKECHLCLYHNKPTGVFCVFFFFYFLLPLFFIADIVQKLRTLLVRSTHFLPSGQERPTRVSIRTQHSLHIAHGRCQLNNKNPYWSCFSLVIAKLILTSACSWRDFFPCPHAEIM